MECFNRRLRWVRKTLELTLASAGDAVNITPGTICYWETASRARESENLTRLIEFYNQLWVEKFPNDPPRYHGEKVSYITLQFLIIGKDENLRELESFNDEVVKKLRKEIVDLVMENENLKQRVALLETKNDALIIQ